MRQGRRYRLNTPTLGLTDVDQRRIALQIPANAVVTFTRPLLGDTRFVEVEWEGKTLALFGSDMLDRGEPVEFRARQTRAGPEAKTALGRNRAAALSDQT